MRNRLAAPTDDPVAYYRRPAHLAGASPPYRLEPLHAFSDAQRGVLEGLLDVAANPYRDYAGFRAEIRHIARHRLPGFLRELVDAARRRDLREHPVVYLRNCPTGFVPELDYDDPLNSKYERKRDYIAEAFHAVFAELNGAAPVGYRHANRGDMFHDITPMRQLAHTITQRTLDTLHFHFDLPDHQVRPDWVYLLSLRNAAANAVYTPIVRLKDVFQRLDDDTLHMLRQPVYAQPQATHARDIPRYGVKEAGYREARPLVVDHDGQPALMYFEGCHDTEDPRGRQAIESLRQVLHGCKYDLFLEEGSFVAISNHDSMHARHVVEIRDPAAHRRRWLLKAWVVNDIETHHRHFIEGRMHVCDE